MKKSSIVERKIMERIENNSFDETLNLYIKKNDVLEIINKEIDECSKKILQANVTDLKIFDEHSEVVKVLKKIVEVIEEKY